MGLKEFLVDSCLPFFIRKKKKSKHVEKKVKKKWTKPGEAEKHEKFKSENGGVSFVVDLPEAMSKSAAGTPRPASHARFMKLEDLDGETRYKADVYRRRERLLSARSTKIKETNSKKHAACLERKKKLEEEFRCKSRAALSKKEEKCHANLVNLEVAAKGSRGRVRLYSAVRRANTINNGTPAPRNGADDDGENAAAGVDDDAKKRSDAAVKHPGE